MGIKTKESDHNVIQTTFDLKVVANKDEYKLEMYNLKNKENQKKFKQYTSNNKALSSIFESNDNLDILTERFLKKLNGCIAMNFSKIRIKEKKNDKVMKMHDKLRDLKNKTDEISREELEKVKKRYRKCCSCQL